MYCKETVKHIFNLGCFRRKTYHLKFPNINSIYHSHFIRGLFDGDGCILQISSNTFYFSITGKISFTSSINEILPKGAMIKIGKVTRKNSNNDTFGALQYSKNSSLIKLRTYLYNNSNEFYINRKFDKFYQIKEKLPKGCKTLNCTKKHEAKGYCSGCYLKKVFYKPKKINRIICSKNLITNEIIKF